MASAVDVIIGAKGTLSAFGTPTYWQAEGADAEKLHEWSTRCFDGVMFGLPKWVEKLLGCRDVDPREVDKLLICAISKNQSSEALSRKERKRY